MRRKRHGGGAVGLMLVQLLKGEGRDFWLVGKAKNMIGGRWMVEIEPRLSTKWMSKWRHLLQEMWLNSPPHISGLNVWNSTGSVPTV